MKRYIGHGENCFTTIDKKSFPFIKGDEASKAEALSRAEAHDRARVSAIEAKLGRPLLESEYYAGQVHHSDSRDLMTRQKESQFQVVKKPESKYSKLKNEIARKIQERDVAKMDTLERQLWDITRLENQNAAIIAEQTAKDNHLSSPRVKAALQELHNLLDDYRWNDSVDAGEVQRVKNAILQWEAHDGDSETAEIMLRQVLDNEDNRIQAQETAKHEAIAALQATLRGDKKTPKLEIDRSLPLRERASKLYHAMTDDERFSFDETEILYNAIQRYESGETDQLEKVVDTFAATDSEMIAS